MLCSNKKMLSLPSEFIVMGNEECGNSTGRDREEKINEVQKMQCVGHQDKNHLGH